MKILLKVFLIVRSHSSLRGLSPLDNEEEEEEEEELNTSIWFSVCYTSLAAEALESGLVQLLKFSNKWAGSFLCSPGYTEDTFSVFSRMLSHILGFRIFIFLV